MPNPEKHDPRDPVMVAAQKEKPAPEPVEMVKVRKNSCTATVRKADLAKFEAKGFKLVEPK